MELQIGPRPAWAMGTDRARPLGRRLVFRSWRAGQCCFGGLALLGPVCSAQCVRPSILGAALTHSAQRSAQGKQSIAAAPSRLRLRRAQEQRQGPGIRGSEQAAKSPNSVVRHIPSTSASASASGDRARRARRDLDARHLLAAGMWGIGIACSPSRRVSRNTTRLVRGMRRVCRAVQSDQ